VSEDIPASASTSAEAVPADTGSTGTQSQISESQNQALIPSASAIPIDQSHTGATLSEWADSRNQFPLNLVASVVRDKEVENKYLQDKLRQTEEERDRFREQYHEQAKEVAVLLERLKAIAETRRLQQIVLGFGGILAGAGLGCLLQISPIRGTDIVMAVLGMLLIIGSQLDRRKD
jgi:hypothetical protein